MECQQFREVSEFFASEYKWAAARGLQGAALSYLVAGLTRSKSDATGYQRTAPMLVVTAKADRAEEIYDNLLYFGIQEVYHYPKWDILPYEEEEPIVEVRAKHAETFRALAAWRSGDALGSPPPIIIAPVDALLQQLVSPDRFAERSMKLEWAESIDTQDLSRRLTEAGYERVPMVESHGEFSIRGGVIDVFPVDAEDPIRVDLFGDEIESVRVFNAQTQRSQSEVDMEQPLLVLPAKPHELAEEALEDGDTLAAFTDYLTPDSRLILESAEDYSDIARVFDEIVQREWLAARNELDRGHRGAAPYDPERLYLNGPALQQRLIEFQRLSVYFILTSQTESASQVIEFETNAFDAVAPDFQHYVNVIRERQAEDYLVNIVCDNDGQATRLKELLEDAELGAVIVFEGDTEAQAFRPHSDIEGYQDVVLTVGQLHAGFEWEAARVVFVTDREIFGRYKRRHVYRKVYKGAPIASAAEIKRDDFVVHVEHGVGRYVGMRTQEVDEKLTEFLEIEYADEGRLLVPLEKVRLVQKFSHGSDGASPTLDRIGGKRWEKRKKKTQEAIEDMAEELLELYARRTVARGYEYDPDTVWQSEFEASFLYKETPDQLTAIAEMKGDMEGDRPMDRLICGDVGFGKTEVAIRAIFKAVQEKRQAAVLAPTTILAQQHYNTLRERFADYPIKVAQLSRFRTAAEQRQTIADLRVGEVQVVVGTHRLLSKDIGFADLGLVVIDEEQRFGVRQKERLKELRSSVDVLTLSATPIPRTLHMALSGIRDMSLISTPPADRLPIKTRVIRFDKDHIAEAILRELNRGGQVYFVHNRVHNIQAVAKQIHEIVPRARIAIAHGQMNEHQLEDVMTQFIEGEHDILLATTIIENGLDIPNVNTIIINRADAFGLAQLYQLRGRVGRDVKRAYAYLIVPAGQAITDTAVRRLRAIEEFTELGVGFNIAMRDLEIRGVGNVLGARQHGAMEEVGFELYCQMLEEAVHRLRGEDVGVAIPAEIKWNASAALPRGYVPVETQRIAIYKRLAAARELGDLEEIADEIRDRYGEPPAAATNLVGVTKLRLVAGKAGIERVTATDFGFRVTPRNTSEESLRSFLQRIRAIGEKGDTIHEVKASRKGYLQVNLERDSRAKQLQTAVDVCAMLAG